MRRRAKCCFVMILIYKTRDALGDAHSPFNRLLQIVIFNERMRKQKTHSVNRNNNIKYIIELQLQQITLNKIHQYNQIKSLKSNWMQFISSLSPIHRSYFSLKPISQMNLVKMVVFCFLSSSSIQINYKFIRIFSFAFRQIVSFDYTHLPYSLAFRSQCFLFLFTRYGTV